MSEETYNQEKVMAAYQIAIQGDFDHARMILEECLYDEPKNVEAWLLLADLAETSEEARQCYQMVLEAAPDNWIAQQRLKLLFQKQQAPQPVEMEPQGFFEKEDRIVDGMDFSDLLADDFEDVPESGETFKAFLTANKKWVKRAGIGLGAFLAVIALAWVGSIVYIAWYMGFLIIGG